MGLFPVFSSFSHSCVFNANHTFESGESREYEVTIRARGAIDKGDEITVGHIKPWVADRAARIEKRYGTKCRCNLCDSGWGCVSKKGRTEAMLQQIIDMEDGEVYPDRGWDMAGQFTKMQRCMSRVVAHEYLGPSPDLVEEYSTLMSILRNLGKSSTSDRYQQAVRDGVKVARLCLPPNHYLLQSLETRLSDKNEE